MPLKTFSLAVAATVSTICFAPAAAAQSSLQVPIQFDFLAPGARSLALGGAFVGLADDATASWVNPAGLLELTRPEVSIEGRYRRQDQPFLVGGRLSGQPTGSMQDTLAGPEYADIRDSSTRPTFVSFIYPRGQFRIAAYRHEPIRVAQEFSSRGVFQNHGFDTRDTAFSGQRELNVTTYGVSIAQAWRRLWVGGGISINRFSLGFDFERHAHQSFYGAPDPRQRVFTFNQAGDSTSVGLVVGALVPVSSRTKIGASYRHVSSFEFSSVSDSTPGVFETEGGTTPAAAHFNVPDVLAAGVSTRVGDALLVTTEYKHVSHSQLRSDYVVVLASQGESRDRVGRFTIDDANEWHAGAEYLLPLRTDPRLRAGAWFDPDHSVHFAPTAANDLLDERIAASLSSGRDLWHYTVGGSITVHPRLELSIGADRSSRSLLLSTSAIVRF
jgi:long-chain fatty acid transport protein